MWIWRFFWSSVDQFQRMFSDPNSATGTAIKLGIMAFIAYAMIHGAYGP
jgi:hypothetical protein